jgi:GMP synthase-like glutamine amidotransferase
MVFRSVPFSHRLKVVGSDPSQEMAWQMKGMVDKCDHREYGFAQIKMTKIAGENASVDALFDGLGDEMQVFPARSNVVRYSLYNL